jgi:hypothetical protein
VGACGKVLSRQALNVAAFQDPSASIAYLVLKALGRSDWMPGLISGRRGRRNELIGGEIMHAHDYRKEGKR